MIDRKLLNERLFKAYEILLSKGAIHSQTDLAKALDIQMNRMNDAFNLRGRAMTTGLLERVADAFPAILRREWLVEGKGSPEMPDPALRPHVDAHAAAGFMDGISEGKFSDQFRQMAFPVISYDFSIDASGNSMKPRIEDGDTLFCRLHSDRLNPPIGKICVIDTKEGAVVKVIAAVDEEAETLTLHSLNPRYRDFPVDFSSINRIALVVASLRTFN